MSELGQEAIAPTIAAECLELSEASRALAIKMGIVSEIHGKDFIFRFVARKWPGDQDRAVTNYYQLGDYSAKLSRDILNEVIKIRKVLKDDWLPGQVLDFASGYGCVSRHLALALPQSTVCTCDIHPEAVAFNSDCFIDPQRAAEFQFHCSELTFLALPACCRHRRQRS